MVNHSSRLGEGNHNEARTPREGGTLPLCNDVFLPEDYLATEGTIASLSSTPKIKYMTPWICLSCLLQHKHTSRLWVMGCYLIKERLNAFA